MNLTFKEKIKDKETAFIEKIWWSFSYEIAGKHIDMYGMDYHRQFSKFWYRYFDFQFKNLEPKKHTIRKDEKDRWKVGNKIHFIINNRSKDRFQFAPIHLVTKIQKIVILPDSGAIMIDDILLTKEQKEKLYRNDGFESKADFWAFFDQEFEGKIIHWTNDKFCY